MNSSSRKAWSEFRVRRRFRLWIFFLLAVEEQCNYFLSFKKFSEKRWETCSGHVSSQKGLVRVLVLGFLFVCSMRSKWCCHETSSCVQIFENVDNHQPWSILDGARLLWWHGVWGSFAESWPGDNMMKKNQRVLSSHHCLSSRWSFLCLLIWARWQSKNSLSLIPLLIFWSMSDFQMHHSWIWFCLTMSYIFQVH